MRRFAVRAFAVLPLVLAPLAACTDPAAEKDRAFALAYRSGVEAVEAHDFAAAEQHLSEAAALDPADPYVQLDLGVAYQNLGRFDDARRAYALAAATGATVKPARVTDPNYAGRSVADLARDNLASLPP